MTASQDMIRGRSNIVTLTNNSGGALIAGDVCVQDATGDEYVTTTTSAASTLKIFIAAESIASAATGKFYSSGYCPLVTPSASVTRGRYLFTHTVAKQAAENATYGAGAFGVILTAGTTPAVWLFGATAQSSVGGVTRSGATTDNHLAVWDGSNADSIKDGGAPSSGGAVISTSAYASPPSTPNAGDLWIPNNSLYELRYSGSAWVPWGPLMPLTLPDDSAFAWVNQGGATVSSTQGVVTITAPASASTSARIRQKASPVASYSITGLFLLNFRAANYAFVLFGWRQSSDGKLHHLRVGFNVTYQIDVVQATNETSDSSATATYPFYSPFIMLKITDDLTTNRTFSFSNDLGISWQDIVVTSRTTWLTPDQVFWAADSRNSIATAATCLSWKQA